MVMAVTIDTTHIAHTHGGIATHRRRDATYCVASAVCRPYWALSIDEDSGLLI